MIVPLEGDKPLMLGRDPAAAGGEVTRHDPHLSQQHVNVLPVCEDWYLSPEMTVNGLFVRIEGTHQLKAGDEFIVGATHGRVVELADDFHVEPSEQPSGHSKLTASVAEQDSAENETVTPLTMEVSGVED